MNGADDPRWLALMLGKATALLCKCRDTGVREDLMEEITEFIKELEEGFYGDR